MKIAIWGFGKPAVEAYKILKGTAIDVVYVKSDYNRQTIDDFKSQLKTLGMESFFVNEIPSLEIDLIFTINYNRLIPESILNKYRIVNYHVGLLPRWRGNGGNGWGVINGENAVGYTIHEMWPMLDAGPIYYQFAYPYMEGDTYLKARIAMAKDLEMKLPQLLLDIYAGKVVGKEQKGPFTYCATFRPIDGFVNWNESTDTILRRFYVFGPPLGTGLRFNFKGNTYTITKISRIVGFASAIGVPGSIVYRKCDSIWVKTGDTAVSVDEVTLNDDIIDMKESFIIGQRFEK